MPQDYTLTEKSPAANQRRPEYERDDAWIRDLLRRGRVAHIATRWDDQPFVTPTNYWFDEGSHRLIFHSNVVGRLRANIDRHARVSAEISEVGRALASNIALEFSMQYRTVMVFGAAQVVTNVEDQKQCMHAMISKYFPGMEAGREYRGATEKELKRTSVYALQIEAWSGKENWKDRADQSDEWPALDAAWLGTGR